MATTAKLDLAPRAKPKTPTQALAMVRIHEKWHVQLLRLDGDRIIGREVVDTSYHRDLAEDAIRKWSRILERP